MVRCRVSNQPAPRIRFVQNAHLFALGCYSIVLLTVKIGHFFMKPNISMNNKSALRPIACVPLYNDRINTAKAF